MSSDFLNICIILYVCAILLFIGVVIYCIVISIWDNLEYEEKLTKTINKIIKEVSKDE